MRSYSLSLSFSKLSLEKIKDFFIRHETMAVFLLLVILSFASLALYSSNNLSLAYNDARSHLNIARRVVEGLKPGLAQLGSVWLPLPHVLMLPTIWSDFMWHSGLSGAMQSMVSYIATGLIVFAFLKKLGVSIFGRVFGVLLFATNVNVLYLQSTAMTELLLLATMTAAAYQLVKWSDNDNILHLAKAAFFVFLSTLIRYDGWFLFLFATCIIALHSLREKGYKTAEGVTVFFSTLAGFGVVLWLIWNQLIFKDALYFVLGPYSAKSQQEEFEKLGELASKGDLLHSVQSYLTAVSLNANVLLVLLLIIGAVVFFFDRRIPRNIRLAASALLAPLLFNIIALFMGHSILIVDGATFNIRYGMMMIPSIAIFTGYLIDRAKIFRPLVIGLLLFLSFFTVVNQDVATVDEALYGRSGQKDEDISSWLRGFAGQNDGAILISNFSHDPVVFSSGLPMRRFITEGTDVYWKAAIARPEKYVRYILLRTRDGHDATYRLISNNPGFEKYTLVASFDLGDIYELQPEYISGLPEKLQLTQK